jgi:hypothetical protein
MPTLHIEHGIIDFDLWKTAFNRFADLRGQSGVVAHRVQRPINDPHYIIVDLEFETTDRARAFAEILHEKVWSSRENAPALVGTPQTRILETVINDQLDVTAHTAGAR